MIQEDAVTRYFDIHEFMYISLILYRPGSKKKLLVWDLHTPILANCTIEIDQTCLEFLFSFGLWTLLQFNLLCLSKFLRIFDRMIPRIWEHFIRDFWWAPYGWWNAKKACRQFYDETLCSRKDREENIYQILHPRHSNQYRYYIDLPLNVSFLQ